jgi:fido (protein-threonine AMPylation protein)
LGRGELVKKYIIFGTMVLSASCTITSIAPNLFINIQALHRNKDELKKVHHARILKVFNNTIKKGFKHLTIGDISTIHQLLYQNIRPAYAGMWRKNRVRVNGMIPPSAENLPRLMYEFIRWIQTTKEHRLYVSAKAHLKLVDIHPFKDGNGRTARSVLAIMLLSEGYPIPTFTLQDRHRYSRAIHKALTTGDTKEYYKFIYQGIMRSFKNIKGKF